MNYPTKGPGDFEPDFSDEDAFEAWLEELDDDPHKKLELMESWMGSKMTATGKLIKTEEAHEWAPAYGTIIYNHEGDFLDWLAEHYQALKFRGEL